MTCCYCLFHHNHLVPHLVTPPQSPSAEDSLSPVKCVDCDGELSAEIVRQREDGKEALVCDVCRTAHLSHVQCDGDDFMDAVSADTQLSSNVVSKGPMCKLPGCKELAQVESGEYNGFCSKIHCKMASMMAQIPVSSVPTMSQRSPTSPTGECSNQSVTLIMCVTLVISL